MRCDRFVGTMLLAALTATAGAIAADGSRLTLSGSLRAQEAERFSVPLTNNWRLQLTWLAEEGSAIEIGDPIARFDEAGIADQLATAEEQLAEQLQQKVLGEGEGKLQRLQHELELRRAEIELRKATIDADVPDDVLEGKDYQERQLELARAEKRLADARVALETHEETHRSRMTGHEVAIRQLRAQIARFRDELDSLELTASRAGIVIHEIHPWFGRKVREGDNLQASFPVASIPDISTLEVEAWATEIDLQRLRTDQTVTLSLDAYPGRRFGGRVLSIGRGGHERDAWGRTPYFRVRIELDERDPKLMRPGMSARCSVELGDDDGTIAAGSS